ncbi:RDD family protein [Alteromonas sp. ASW11-130]|uniref:RDD family protein n=1 Tax=Alteromonas sp. ASW11-130 TaxID=3015775 RepID=UPI0022422F17|nr:RDD family protein [Alteromonas sp. ASW11-130]MCW8092445.1 RDD family protein [Alteromonas sp. ASW11-130]
MSELVSTHREIKNVAEQKISAENRQIVTPYAFQVSSELLGKQLATPVKRLMALLVDLSVVSIVSFASAFVLAFFAAITFFRAGSHLSNRPKRSLARKCLRLGASLLLFVTIFGLVGFIEEDIIESSPIDPSTSFSEKVISGVGFVAFDQCEADIECVNALANELSSQMAETNIDRDSVKKLIESQLGGKGLTPAQEKAVIATYLNAFDRKRAELETEAADLETPAVGTPETNEESHSYSVIGWIKGISADLGLGFGWAALYFSVFTAWWGGITPGKKLFGLRVVKLDNSQLTLWESFGRYGGYGAGFATGLLGFLQIYWDPNRQAIQDKISETLVIDTRKEARIGSVPITH